MLKQETPPEKRVAFLFQCARNPDYALRIKLRRGKQDGSSIAMTRGNKKTSMKEVFCFQCPEQDLNLHVLANTSS
jgi:hypothetical protein